MPKVSVIIPVYNTEKYLKECLDSVICQTLTDIEIICVNDGSTDSSLEILKEYASKDERIKVLEQKNKGAGAARNLGLKYAKGEYLAFLDSDDFYNPDFLEKMYNKANKTLADLVICSVNSYDTVQSTYLNLPWSLDTNFLPEKEIFNYRDIPNYIFNISQNWNWNKIFRRDFIGKNKIKFQEIYRTNDLLFTCKALILAKRITTVKEALVNYRTGQDSNSQSTNHLYPLDFYKAFKELRKFLIRIQKYNEVEKSYLSWAIDGCAYNIISLKDEKIAQKVMKKVFTNGFKELGLKYYQKFDLRNCYNLEAFKSMQVSFRKQSKEFTRQIFSLRNSEDKKHKIITIFGIKLKLKRKGR